jgi:hypothetical protein
MTAILTYDPTNVIRAPNGRIGPKTREAWHGRIYRNGLLPIFQSLGIKMPERIRFSCGWPPGSRGGKKTTLGVCFFKEASADHSVEIFVSPIIADSLMAAGILAHELVHAALGTPGHGADFKRLALMIGLQGPMKEALPGPELQDKLREIVESIGPYPHAELGAGQGKAADKPDKQTTRMLKVVCPDADCPHNDAGNPYLVRTTQKWVDCGLPTCPCGVEMVLSP